MAKLLVLFVIAFVDMVGLAMILPLLPFYASSLGVNAVAVGILISAFSVAQLASAPFWGRFSDNRGRRRALLAGLIITTIAYALFGVASSLTILLVSRLIQGIGGGTIGVVQAYVVDVSTSRDRTKTLGWLTAVTSLGAVVGPVFGSTLVAVGGRSTPGFAAAGLTVIVAIFAWRYLQDVEQTETIPDNDAPTKYTSEFSAIKHVLTGWRQPAPRLVLTYAIAIGAFYGTVPIMPLLLQDRLRITEQTIGYVIMYLGGVGVLVRSIVLGKMIERYGEDTLSRMGVVCLALGLAVLAVTTDFTTLIVSLTLMPLGTAFLFPAITARLSRSVSRDQRGLYMGVQHTYGGVTRVMFPILTGLAMDQLGFGIPFFGAALLVIAILWLMPDARERTIQRSSVDLERITIEANQAH